MKIVIVAGSHRQNSESERAANFIKKSINKITADVDAEVYSLSGNPIPFFDEKVWTDDAEWKKVWGPVSAKMKSADGFVIVSPEWGGMAPPGLKNLFVLCTKNELAHKPALIVTVSSGIGGAYPVAELRMSSYKNSRICYIPEHVIIRKCEEMLHGENPANPHDESLRKRIDYNIKILLEYTEAMQHIKNSPILDYKTYPYGV